MKTWPIHRMHRGIVHNLSTRLCCTRSIGIASHTTLSQLSQRAPSWLACVAHSIHLSREHLHVSSCSLLAPECIPVEPETLFVRRSPALEYYLPQGLDR